MKQKQWVLKTRLFNESKDIENIQGLERNPYDKSIIEKIFTVDFIDRCIFESDDNNYRLIPNWKNLLEEKHFDDLIDNSKDDGKNNLKIINMDISKSILPVVKNLVKNDNVVASGNFIYPPTGYMGWHTNYKVPCKRLYITYATEDKKSFFRYIDPLTKEVVTDYDDKGITMRLFQVRSKPPYFWHCIGSDCVRISLGFKINPPVQKTFMMSNHLN